MTTQQHSTPIDFFQRLDQEFHFTLDACATAENARCERFFSPAEDGLNRDWSGTVWCNPPYTHNQLGLWVRKAYISATFFGATVVMLLPAYTDTAWWHEFAPSAKEIRFVRGRLKFGKSKGNPNFASVVMVFRAHPSWCGPVISSMSNGRTRRRKEQRT